MTISATMPEQCPNCGGRNAFRIYPALYGKDRVPVTVVRCTLCNTGSILPNTHE